MKALGFSLIFSIFLAVGCSTPGVVIEESNYSVKQHRVAITAAFGLVREVSPNGRMLYSHYHDRNLKAIEITDKTNERYYTKATILGSIRPFRVSVEVINEARDPESREWSPVGDDEELALKRMKTIKSLLNQSRDEGGTFDEEAPF